MSGAIARLMPFVYALAGNVHDAEDLLQDALTTVLVKWRRVSEVADRDAYTRRIMVNTLISRRRRKSSGEIPTDRFSDETDRRRETDCVDDRDSIVRLLADLPTKQRVVLVLRYLVDLPDDQIAEHLGCRVGAVRVLSSRALASLRERTGSPSVV